MMIDCKTLYTFIGLSKQQFINLVLCEGLPTNLEEKRVVFVDQRKNEEERISTKIFYSYNDVDSLTIDTEDLRAWHEKMWSAFIFTESQKAFEKIPKAIAAAEDGTLPTIDNAKLAGELQTRCDSLSATVEELKKEIQRLTQENEELLKHLDREGTWRGKYDILSYIVGRIESGDTEVQAGRAAQENFDKLKLSGAQLGLIFHQPTNRKNESWDSNAIQKVGAPLKKAIESK